uniref:C-type lectin domain-containing protein n=1 Tax=Poecilia reticulata TaxID=8081 RepID=A0A3P9PT74_POERE
MTVDKGHRKSFRRRSWELRISFIYFFSISYYFTKVSLLSALSSRCKPCLHDWIFFQKKCYLFYDEPAPWKTWEQSRRFCQDRRADLVVIDDLEDKHVKSYFEIQWGYWLGLQQTNNSWTWVDGLNILSCKHNFSSLQICLGYICFLCMKK